MTHLRPMRRCWSGCWLWMMWMRCTPLSPAWTESDVDAVYTAVAGMV